MNLKKLNEALFKCLKEDDQFDDELDNEQEDESKDVLNNGWYYSSEERGWYIEQVHVGGFRDDVDCKFYLDMDSCIFEVIADFGIAFAISARKAYALFVKIYANQFFEDCGRRDLELTDEMLDRLIPLP